MLRAHIAWTTKFKRSNTRSWTWNLFTTHEQNKIMFLFLEYLHDFSMLNLTIDTFDFKGQMSGHKVGQIHMVM